jgi:hypothetical protein
MSARSWFTPAATRLRAANPYTIDRVLFAASLQWMCVRDGVGDPGLLLTPEHTLRAGGR